LLKFFQYSLYNNFRIQTISAKTKHHDGPTRPEQKNGHILPFYVKVSMRQSKIDIKEHQAYLTFMINGKNGHVCSVLVEPSLCLVLAEIVWIRELQ